MGQYVSMLPCGECGKDVQFSINEYNLPHPEESVYSGTIPRHSYHVEVLHKECEHDQNQFMLDLVSRLQSGVTFEEIERDPHPDVSAVGATERLGAADMTPAERSSTTPPGEGGVILMDRIDVADDEVPEPIEIFEVYYKKLISTGNYEHEEVGARAAVPMGVDAWDVFERLKGEVLQHCGAEDQAAVLQRDITYLTNRRREIVGELRAMKAEWERFRGFLEKIGVPLDRVREHFTEAELDAIPF